MTALERHGEIMGALGKIEQKADDCHTQLLRHEAMHESHVENISDIQNAISKGKGAAWFAAAGVTALGVIGAAVAKAKELF